MTQTMCHLPGAFSSPLHTSFWPCGSEPAFCLSSSSYGARRGETALAGNTTNFHIIGTEIYIGDTWTPTPSPIGLLASRFHAQMRPWDLVKTGLIIKED